MDRTARMLRRTLLCAVFACPLAIVCLPAAYACQALFALTWSLSRRGALRLWHTGPQKGHIWRRLLFALCQGLGCSALLHALLRRALSLRPPLSGLMQAVCLLTSLLIQATLILRIQQAGRLHIAACLPALLVFIACMQ